MRQRRTAPGSALNLAKLGKRVRISMVTCAKNCLVRMMVKVGARTTPQQRPIYQRIAIQNESGLEKLASRPTASAGTC